MKPAMLALAILAQGGAVAHAQTSLAFYGVMDLGLSVDRGGVAGVATRVTSGMATQSRWGVRGSEELGNGMAAFFVVEGGIRADSGRSTQNDTLFGRNAAVGLRGRYGALSLGLQDTPLFTTLNVVVDPLRNGIVRSNNLMAPTGFRANNAILYRSPELRGFSADLMVVPGEVAGDSAAARAWGGSVGYGRGPLVARLAHHRRNNDTLALQHSEAARNTLLGANYNFGPVKGYAGYEINKGPNSAPLNNPLALVGGAAAVASTDSRDLLLAASVPWGASTAIASYVRKDDRTRFDQDARQMGFAYMFAFSRRSDVYTSYALIRNRNGAAYTEGNSEEPGTGDRQFTLGLRHRF